MITNIKNMIEEYRKLHTPPCNECECFSQINSHSWCECSSYLDYIARVHCIFTDSVDVRIVRGTKYCKFKQK